MTKPALATHPLHPYLHHSTQNRRYGLWKFRSYPYSLWTGLSLPRVGRKHNHAPLKSSPGSSHLGESIPEGLTDSSQSPSPLSSLQDSVPSESALRQPSLGTAVLVATTDVGIALMSESPHIRQLMGYQHLPGTEVGIGGGASNPFRTLHAVIRPCIHDNAASVACRPR